MEFRKVEELADGLVPELASRFYGYHSGFQDPFGDGRRLLAQRGVVSAVCEHLLQADPEYDIAAFVTELLERAPSIPAPINADYSGLKGVPPFPPHLICFALAYVEERPDPRFIRPLTLLIVRTGWWAGDEGCIDDILDALDDKPTVCRIAAESLLERISSGSVFAAGQLLYHLGYGQAYGLRPLVREMYQAAATRLEHPEDLREVRDRMSRGLKNGVTLRP